jgi:purine-binding chemotaxis protein CheW
MEQVKIANTLKVIVFQIKDNEYAIPVSYVKGIEKILHITRVPKTVAFVKGVINLRGVITPIIDLRARFEIEEKAFNDKTRIIIVHLQDIEVGLIVDAANDVLDIPIENIEPQPEVVGNVEAAYISGVVKIEKRLLIVINLEQVLNTEELDEISSSKEGERYGIY